MSYMDHLSGTSQHAGAENRRHQRRMALIGVKLRLPGESWFTSRVTDLSSSGFRLLSYVRLEPGATIWVMFPGFEGRRATVIWNKDYESGCAFERPMHAAVLDHIVRMGSGGESQD